MPGLNLDILTTTGIDNAVPQTRTITINSTTFDLSADRVYTVSGTGLTSVGLTVPSGFSVSNSPLTANGNIALSFSVGFSLPTDVRQSQWDSSYNFTSVFPSQIGNAGKFLTTNGTVLSFATVSGITDGDRGDITISGSGTIFTIDPQVVSFAKIQNVAANTFLANVTGASASVQEIATNRTVIFPTAITGTPSATTFLRGDGAWQTPTAGGTPGGATGTVQFNNAGAFAGAANVEIDAGDLSLIDAGFPTSPAAGRTKIFTDSMATRRIVGSIDPSGFHFDFQPALFNSSIYMWLPGTGTTLAINWGTSYTARNNGSNAAQATPTMASTNAITSLNRATFSTGTTTTGASGIQSSAAITSIGSSTGLGGFFFFSRFAIEARSGTHRLFVGLSANNATLNAQPSTLNNTLGIGLDSADVNLQFMIRNAATTTRIDTTIAVDTTTIYDFYMYCEPNGSTIFFELRNAVTNAVLKNSQETVNLPANTIFFFTQAHIQSVTGTTAKLLALNRMYLETNL